MSDVETNPLWTLIFDGMKRHADADGTPLSFRATAARSKGKITRGDLTNWQAGKIKLPSPKKLIGISETLDIPLPQVVAAALDTVGLRSALGAATPEDAIKADPQLPELDKHRLLGLLREIRQRAEASEEDVELERAAMDKLPKTNVGETEESDT